MTTEEWKKVGAVLDELLELTEADQDAFLKDLQARDPRLHEEVASLLREQDPSQRFIHPPTLLGNRERVQAAVSHSTRDDSETEPEDLPKVRGYELLEMIGVGGM